MSRALINKEAVFKAAKNLTEHGVFPTQSRVREHLGHGSMRDIGFYLREWKQQCMAANKSSPILQEELAYATLETENLENSNKKLIKQQKELQLQLEEISGKLKATEKKAHKWQLEAEKLQVELGAQKHLDQQFQEKYHNMENMLQEKAKDIELIVSDKNELIASLRQELKETTHQAIVEAREYSYLQNDKLMEIKIEKLNLQEEIKLLNRKIKDQAQQILTLQMKR